MHRKQAKFGVYITDIIISANGKEQLLSFSSNSVGYVTKKTSL